MFVCCFSRKKSKIHMKWTNQLHILQTHHCIGIPSVLEIESTHWGREKTDAIFQTTFSNAFSWMQMYEFRLKYYRILFPRVQLIIFKHWFWQWLGSDQATSHYLNRWWSIYWCILASLGPNLTNSIKTGALKTNYCPDINCDTMSCQNRCNPSWII